MVRSHSAAAQYGLRTVLSDETLLNLSAVMIMMTVFWVASVMTGLSHLYIAFGIWAWQRALPLRSVTVYASCFASLFVFFGLSRFEILFDPQYLPPWWDVLFLVIPLALLTIFTAICIHFRRNDVNEALRNLYQVYLNHGG